MAQQEGAERAEERRGVVGDVILTSRLKNSGGMRLEIRCSFVPLDDESESILGRGGIPHHLAAD